ncbi:hypothetical protein ACH427_17225, partial [Streptomyces sp. NPDC020379]|uniref:hypothetical protein n=1 Tax=Streptomyces sp. NPDC020379 TaxID=3365071 RepID=UPI00378F5ACE
MGSETPISSAEMLLIKSVKPESEKLEGEPRSNRGPEKEFGPETGRKTDLVRLETRNTEGKRPEESPRG